MAGPLRARHSGGNRCGSGDFWLAIRMRFFFELKRLQRAAL